MTLSHFADVLVGLVNWFSWFVALTAVVLGLYSGFLFMTARDDAVQLSRAKKLIVWTVVGIAVSIISFGIIALIKPVL